MADSVKYLLIWINIGSFVSAGYRYYAMDNPCGQVISLDADRTFGAILTLNLTNASPSQGLCPVTLARSTSAFSHLHFFVSDFKTDVTDCSKYSLTVENGNSQNSTNQHSDIGQVCDSSNNQVSYTTWMGYLKFTFTWNTTVPSANVLIVVNAYSPDACLDDDDKSQTECKNGRCIPSTLTCQGYNPCGDNSDCVDEDKEMSYAVRILYTIGSALVFIFLSAILYNLCFKTKWSERCKCEDSCCCHDLCVCWCLTLRDCFGACFTGIKKSGSKLKGCCCRICCQNTVSTNRTIVNVTLPEQSPAYDDGNDVAPPPYSLRAFSPPPTYSVAMRNAPPPEYSEVVNISIGPTLEPPPAYDAVTRNSSDGRS